MHEGMIVYFSSCMFDWGRFLVLVTLTIHLPTGRGRLAGVADILEGAAATEKEEDRAWVCMDGSPFGIGRAVR